MAVTAAADRPRKIIGVISFMNAAGAQEALLRLARQMRARGHDMEVWFLYQQDAIHADEPFIRVFETRVSLTPVQYLSVFIRLWRALAVAKPEAVLGFLPLGNVFGLTAAVLAGVPVRIASQRAPGWTFGRVIRALDWGLGSTQVYGRIVCVSQAVQASFNRYPAAYRAKLCVVHNGVEWRSASETRHEARHALGLAPDAFIHVAIGRLTPQKNYSLLIEAFTGVPEGLLVIAGDGPLRASLEAQVAASGLAGRVIFLGAIDRAAVRLLLRAADVFVQPSLFEGQSNAVLEAMHAALPIVASDIAEQRETLVDPETGEAAGLLVPPYDVQAWTRALNDLHADPQRRASLAETASESVERRFGLNRMIDGFEAALGLS
jgi:glycosyltransferase involved in cell wall biosynthesis